MRLEVRKTDEDTDRSTACPECGATELVATKTGTLLAFSLPGQRPSWWRPIRRMAHREIRRLVDDAVEQLRDETRKV